MEQLVLKAHDNYAELKTYLLNNKIDNIFVVCLKHIEKFNIYEFLNNLNLKITYFKDFSPNPTYESVCTGIREFKKSGSKFIMAIGGGSAMDLAKAIKLYASSNSDNYLKEEILPNDITLLAVPTTAGTGSEATKFAVIYYQGEKQSITHESIIPSVVLFDDSFLKTLPIYQKKVTVLDALSHGIESFWSVNANDQSREYSRKAIKIILDNFDSYLNGACEEEMLIAANLAGKAINITQTTAGHAMCYKLTSLYNIAHGHACALVNSVLLPFMLKKSLKDKNNKLLDVFNELKILFELKNFEELSSFLSNLLEKLDLYDISVSTFDIELLSSSVNETRLKNNPIPLTKEDIKELYLELFKKIEKRK